MKTVGVIGGLGPETTAKFYQEIISLCYKKNKKTRPPILMWSIPLPYKIESELIRENVGTERYLPFLRDAAKRLEDGGADFLVMPCNSLHVFIKEIRDSVNIPVLNIVEEMAKYLEAKDINKTGLLATATTIKSKLYENAFKEIGVLQVLPSEKGQVLLGKIIDMLVLGKETKEDRNKLLGLIRDLSSKGNGTVVLACTDLQLVVPKIKGVEIYDSMRILAERTADTILS